ncbi:MAG TPA: hypothetical protein VGE74_14770 [Gemmata sp.]
MNESRPWWLWPNLLALDAVAVAVTWQVFFASVGGVAVPVASVVVLGLAVWAAYLADRALDARRGAAPAARHRIAGRYARVWVWATVLALVLAVLVGLTLPRTYIRTGLAVSAVALGYFALVHVVRSHRLLGRGVKEASVGLVFAAGAVLPLLAEGHAAAEWLPGAFAFAALCWLNCLLISRWEEEHGRGPPVWLVVTVGAGAAGAALGAPGTVAGAVWVSTAALAGLHAVPGLSVRAARVLADVVLLSPLLVAVWT